MSVNPTSLLKVGREETKRTRREQNTCSGRTRTGNIDEMKFKLFTDHSNALTPQPSSVIISRPLSSQLCQKHRPHYITHGQTLSNTSTMGLVPSNPHYLSYLML